MRKFLIMQKLIKKDIVENCQVKNDTWNWEMGVSEKKNKRFPHSISFTFTEQRG